MCGPCGVGRNALQGGGNTDFDLLWDHDIHLTKAKGKQAKDAQAKVLNFSASVYNVMNHANFTNYIGTLTSTRFGQPSAANSARQWQFGARYQF